MRCKIIMKKNEEKLLFSIGKWAATSIERLMRHSADNKRTTLKTFKASNENINYFSEMINFTFFCVFNFISAKEISSQTKRCSMRRDVDTNYCYFCWRRHFIFFLWFLFHFLFFSFPTSIERHFWHFEINSSVENCSCFCQRRMKNFYFSRRIFIRIFRTTQFNHFVCCRNFSYGNNTVDFIGVMSSTLNSLSIYCLSLQFN